MLWTTYKSKVTVEGPPRSVIIRVQVPLNPFQMFKFVVFASMMHIQPTEVQDIPIDCLLKYICPHSEVNHHPASLGLTCCQHVETYSLCWFSKPESQLQISSYPNVSRKLALVPYTSQLSFPTGNLYLFSCFFILITDT